MGIIIWLIVGGVCGWLASLIMRTDAQQGILMNIVVGIVGAVIAGLVLGKGNINQGLTVETFLWSLLGAVILLAVVNLSAAAASASAPQSHNRGRREHPGGPFSFTAIRSSSTR
jgi:uncharacterized membrane protein YeaQ/YmgE (transglycosylase-associated protein family)